ncbi:MAG TPA: GMC family oxidoreductase N-terminal domain-containing protein [Alphaproteobacteria bacterium]|nr:GMC family oxidoreductase N-terminal domain-containing protein [Alphaproteobacteria bacterium]
MTTPVYDYIIVGAGSAGCVLANRLSADPKNRVLLLEAGPEDKNLWIHIPLGYGKNLTNRAVNWCFDSEPEEHANGKLDYLARGKVLGGSSSINGMVYMRGQKEDYDLWAQMGCRGWSYEDVLPYFKRAENNARGENEFHGVGGPLQVSDLRDRPPVLAAFLAAGQEVGLPLNPDFNGAEQEGIGLTQTTTGKGRRNSTAQAYLKPARSRPNLHVETDARGHRVLFEGKRAMGYAYLHQGQPKEARATREVILCGGAYGSPQLLELSGVGDAGRLREMGIEPVHHLAGVGEGLQDHQVFRMKWRLKGKPGTFNERTRGWRALGEGLRYLVNRGGVLSNPTNPINAFFRTRPELASPDIQLQFFPGTYESMRDRALHREPGVTLGPTLLRLESRGSVHAKSADPLADPAIRTNVLGTQNDLQTAIAAMRFSRAVMETKAMQPFYDFEMAPGTDVQTDDEMASYARESGASNWHPASSCRMGPDGDPMAVVDTSLKVRGLEGLRVVDASVMPMVVCGNTNAPTIMIAEKAADLMLAETRGQSQRA